MDNCWREETRKANTMCLRQWSIINLEFNYKSDVQQLSDSWSWLTVCYNVNSNWLDFHLVTIKSRPVVIHEIMCSLEYSKMWQALSTTDQRFITTNIYEPSSTQTSQIKASANVNALSSNHEFTFGFWSFATSQQLQ